MKKRFDEQYDGPEKKLEIILNSQEQGLRTVPHERWKGVVRAGHAKILSRISTDSLDAYLLSESSLFIWEDRLVMITCGDTSPVTAIPEIMSIIDKDKISFIMYSRKINTYSKEMGSSFKQEAKRIETFFPGRHCHLGSHELDHIHLFYSNNGYTGKDRPNVTFQIFMHDLDNSVIENFTKTDKPVEFPAVLTPIFKQAIPRMITDSHMFNPSGFSLNGIFEDQYLTVHVTPGPERSYMSFETNVNKKDYSGIVSDITSCFKPERFSIVFSSDNHCADSSHHPTLYQQSVMYKEREKNCFDLESGSRITFINFYKNSSREIVRGIASKLFEDSKGSHDWEHTLRVLGLCEKIGKIEGADMDVLTIAAYLHDVGRCHQDRSNGEICHAEKGAGIADDIIDGLDLTDEKKSNIIHCIKSHRFRGNGRPGTIEAKVLFDADKLDAIGAIGVARAYLFAGELGARLHNQNNNIEDTKPYSKDDTGYREFMVKLCRIKTRIITDEGRKIAEERHDFMEKFFKRFLEEHNGER